MIASEVREMLSFIDGNPTAYHTTAAVRDILLKAGFAELLESRVQQAIALHGQRMHGIDLVAGDGSRLRHRFHAAVERTNAIEQLCQNASLRARGAHHFGERRHHAGVVHCDIQGLLVQPPQRRCHGTAAHACPPATGTPRHADQRQQGQTKEGQLTQAIPGP